MGKRTFELFDSLQSLGISSAKDPQLLSQKYKEEKEKAEVQDAKKTPARKKRKYEKKKGPIKWKYVRKKGKNATSKFFGVSWDSRRSRWLCRVKKRDKRYEYVGYFETETEAAAKHDLRVREMYAMNLSAIKLNFPQALRDQLLSKISQSKKAPKKLINLMSNKRVKRHPSQTVATTQTSVMNASDSDSDDEIFTKTERVLPTLPELDLKG